MKLVGGVRGGLALLDDDERRRVIEAGERDIDDGVGFFRGTARSGTALMVAYVDEFRDRFRAGIGRGLVTSVMREPGIRGVRRGGPGLVERGFEAGAPNPATPVLGLQDTGTDRNRVLCKPSGASRPTIGAEQKSGHITMRVIFFKWFVEYESVSFLRSGHTLFLRWLITVVYQLF